MTVGYGESGSGKTFLAVDLACHVAAGKPWRGMDVEQGIVIYVAAESPTSIKRRIWAWKKRHGVEHLPVAVVTATVNLLNGDTEKVVALVQRIREQTGKTVAFIVIDTLARAMIGNENSPEDMGAFVGSCDRIREASGGHIMVVHHSGKDQARGARGHSKRALGYREEESGRRGGRHLRLQARHRRAGPERQGSHGHDMRCCDLRPACDRSERPAARSQRQDRIRGADGCHCRPRELATTGRGYSAQREGGDGRAVAGRRHALPAATRD
jgi:hypothetical protein